MQNFSYHTHTYRCGHASQKCTDEDYVTEYLKGGFKQIAFTDHCPEKELIDTRFGMRMDYSQKDEYLKSIKALKKKYKNKIDILSGFEIEYLPGQEENLLELKTYADMLILGQHFIYSKDKTYLKIFRNHIFSQEDLITYASYIEKACSLNLPDIIAHPDIFMLSSKIFGEAEEECSNIICKAAEKHNIPLEINLGEIMGYVKGYNAKARYPEKSFWDIASKYNVRVLYGIDAHSNDFIKNFSKCTDIANSILGETVNKLNFIKDIKRADS